VERADVLVPRAFFLDPESWMATESARRISREDALVENRKSGLLRRQQAAVDLLEEAGFTVTKRNDPAQERTGQ
jgi:hypothetical protein